MRKRLPLVRERVLLLASLALLGCSPPENGVVFLGDSITNAWGREFTRQFPGKPYIARGVDGQTTSEMRARFQRDVITLKPRAVVILGGTNDVSGAHGVIPLDVTEQNLAAMAEMAKANGVRVILGSVLPMSISPRGRATIVTLNEWIRAYAARLGAEYVDFHSVMRDSSDAMRSDLSVDGIHPTADGYAIMAQRVEAAITAALREQP